MPVCSRHASLVAIEVKPWLHVSSYIGRHGQFSHRGSARTEVGGHRGHFASQQMYPDTRTTDDHSQGRQCVCL